MKRLRRPSIVLGLLYVCFVGYVIASASQLPDRVASHFNGAGQPDDWMNRTSYLWFIILFGGGVPLVVIGLLYLTRFIPKNYINIPYRDYWLAPERRKESSHDILRQSIWLACLLIAFMTGIHYLIIDSNKSTPPNLSTSSVLALMGCFLAGLGAWIVFLYRRFQRPAS